MKQSLKKQSIPYTQVSNAVLNDKKLSWKAKGIFAYLYSKPENWDFSVHRIFLDSRDGKESLLSGISELEEAGYLFRKRLANGKMEYKICFEPCTEKPDEACSGNQNEPDSGKANNGKPVIGKTRTVYNKEVDSNKEEHSNKEEVATAPVSVSKVGPIDISFSEKMFWGISKHSDIFQRKYILESGEVSADGRKKIQAWAEDIELLRRLDKVTDFEIDFILAFIYGGKVTTDTGKEYELPAYESKNFNWFSNIESGKKLREKFKRLMQDAEAHFKNAREKKETAISPLNLDALAHV